MRSLNGEIWSANSAQETVNAAAHAIASAETRLPPATSQKRRWSDFLSIYWCFGSQKQQKKRIGHAVLVPEPTSTVNEAPPAQSLVQPPPFVVPFTAPPSSPASFLPSEPPSAAQSPAGLMSFASISANVYSPGGPRSIFAIGPYAHETQLVTPPVFSAYNTEPSTAPYTPTDSVHLTTPSSPEVPFAQFIEPGAQSGSGGMTSPSQYEFQSHQYYAGSPAGQLISPQSGPSSPFPDHEILAGGIHLRDIRYGVPLKLFNLYSPSGCHWGSGQRSGSLTPDSTLPKSRDSVLLDQQNSTVSDLPTRISAHCTQETMVDHQVYFDPTSEDTTQCAEKGPTALRRALQTVASGERDEYNRSLIDDNDTIVDEAIWEDAAERPTAPANPEEGQMCQRQRSVGSMKEFNFDNANRDESHKPCLGSYWWTNDKVASKEMEQPGRNWS